MREWHPEQHVKTGFLPIDRIMPGLKESFTYTRIGFGSIIVFGDRQPYEVIEIGERPPLTYGPSTSSTSGTGSPSGGTRPLWPGRTSDQRPSGPRGNTAPPLSPCARPCLNRARQTRWDLP